MAESSRICTLNSTCVPNWIYRSQISYCRYVVSLQTWGPTVTWIFALVQSANPWEKLVWKTALVNVWLHLPVVFTLRGMRLVWASICAVSKLCEQQFSRKWQCVFWGWCVCWGVGDDMMKFAGSSNTTCLWLLCLWQTLLGMIYNVFCKSKSTLKQSYLA